MGAVSAAVYNRMASDAELTGLLSVYKGAPAIFTAVPIPGDADLPLVTAFGNATAPSDVPEASKQSVAVRVQRDINCYAQATGSAARVEQIANRVFELFEREEDAINVSGWRVVRARADFPIVGETDETAYGLLVLVELRLEKQ